MPLLLQVTFASPTICNCLFHMFGLSILSLNVVKETAVTMALNIREKKHGVSTNWPNIATFARRGTHKSLLLLNCSSWRRAASATQRTEFEGNHESSTSPGESCARLPAGLRPHRHLWCHSESTWSAQKGTVVLYSPRGRWHIEKKYVCSSCYLSPNPPKTSPLWGVGPIII